MSNLPVPSPDQDYVMASAGEEAAATGSAFQVQRVLGFLLQYWWIPLVTLLLGLGLAVAVILSRPPTYVTDASMQETVKLQLPQGGMFSEDVQNFVGTLTELLKSGTLHAKALAQLQNNHVAVPLGQDGQPLPVSIRVSQASKSSVFTLEATGSNPAYIRHYLDALMQAYLEYEKTARQVVSLDTLTSIDELVKKYEGDLRNAQDRLTAFQMSNNLAVLQAEGTVSGSYLARLKTELSDLEMQNKLLKASLAAGEYAGTNANNVAVGISSASSLDGSAASSGISPEIQTAFTDLETLKIQQQRLGKVLKPKHPKMVRLAAQIDRAQKLIEAFQHQRLEQLIQAQADNRIKIGQIQAAIKEYESKTVEANARIAQADRLKQDVLHAQSVCDSLSTLVQNVDISRNIDQQTLSILDPASAAKRSHSKEVSLAAAGGVGGLGLGFGIIVLIMLLDDRFTSVREVRDKLGDGVVGGVPEVKSIGNGDGSMLVQEGDGRHIYAESYRNLRSAIMYIAAEPERPRVILVTSALPGEGKSTVAANLAKTLALGGSRVLLVDADLRKGSLNEVFGLLPEPGLSELLLNPATLHETIQTDSVPNLSFIAAGARLANPGDLFLHPALTSLLAAWRAQFDYVILDGTPVFAADDATTLAPKVDGTLFVVRRRFSRARQVREAIELLLRRQAKVLGVVFNRIDAASRSHYYYKYAAYYPRTARHEARQQETSS